MKKEKVVKPCQRCGKKITIDRPWKRFCNAKCRLAWNQRNMKDLRGRVDRLEKKVFVGEGL